MKEKFAKLIDVKSIVTLSLVFALVWLVLSGRAINGDLFLLFSNVITMIITYFFTKPKKEDKDGNNSW